MSRFGHMRKPPVEAQLDVEEAIALVREGERVPLREDGTEVLDGTPVAPPIGYRPQPSLASQIRMMVRSEQLRMEAEKAGMETFEEADDFDVGDDFDPTSPYENDFDPPIREVFAEVEAQRKKQAPFPEPDAIPPAPDQGAGPLPESPA